MKKITLPVMALLAAITAGHGLILCTDDWIQFWRTATGTLQNHSSYAYGTHWSGQTNWSVTANHGGTGNQTLTGHSACSWSGGNMFIGATELDYGDLPDTDSGDPGGVCWCRMNVPTRGMWVIASIAFDSRACVGGCEYYCIGAVIHNYPAIRNILLTPAF